VVAWKCHAPLFCGSKAAPSESEGRRGEPFRAMPRIMVHAVKVPRVFPVSSVEQMPESTPA
jgi:hypothetical protein